MHCSLKPLVTLLPRQMEGIHPATQAADLAYTPHLEASPLCVQLAVLRQHVRSLEAQLTAWQGSQKPLAEKIYQDAALPLTQHHEARIQELEMQLQAERRELARVIQRRDKQQQRLVQLQSQYTQQLADLREQTRVLEEKLQQQTEELAVLPLAQLEKDYVHLLLESLGVEVCFDVIDSNGINGAELEAMSEPELFTMFGIATVGQLKRLSQALRDHEKDEQRAALGLRGWSVSRVVEWAREKGMSSEVCQALKTQEIDGCALMGLNRHDMPLLEIGSLSDRRQLLTQVEVVKKESLSEVASEPRSAEAPLPQAEVLEIVLRHNTGLNEELEKLRQRFGSAADEYRCPITMEVMQDPVLASDGNAYERSAITAWLERSSKSPLTRQPLEQALFPNRNLKKLIAQWTEAH